MCTFVIITWLLNLGTFFGLSRYFFGDEMNERVVREEMKNDLWERDDDEDDEDDEEVDVFFEPLEAENVGGQTTEKPEANSPYEKPRNFALRIIASLLVTWAAMVVSKVLLFSFPSMVPFVNIS